MLGQIPVVPNNLPLRIVEIERRRRRDDVVSAVCRVIGQCACIPCAQCANLCYQRDAPLCCFRHETHVLTAFGNRLQEALSGAAYIAVGILGIWLAAGFLDPRFLSTGEFGQLFSAGAIPVIYSLIGLKVGSEITGIIDAMRRSTK